MQWFRIIAVLGMAVSLSSCSFENGAPNGSAGSQQANAFAAQSRIEWPYLHLMSQTTRVDGANGFKITSTTFKNDSKVPTIMRGVSKPQCDGGDQSPPFSWSGAPAGTKSFAVVLFDVTANFGHWGIYNVRPTATQLPQDIKPGNKPGHWLQVTDDAGVQGYFGPCPPNAKPLVHRYVFTIYALDKMLTLRTFGSLPGPTIDTLFRAMIDHVKGRASITGLASYYGKT